MNINPVNLCSMLAHMSPNERVTVSDGPHTIEGTADELMYFLGDGILDRGVRLVSRSTNKNITKTAVHITIEKRDKSVIAGLGAGSLMRE